MTAEPPPPPEEEDEEKEAEDERMHMVTIDSFSSRPINFN